ncbi:MAG: ketoacyl-ACP synthase III [Saprospiraceae bacterium]|jgi:3-oxoacyl-[acyl-carrier-protein] synthase-3|nr:ketoacyl-ACP synthase III [Saprospiraceae bacterium]MCA0332924.1 ketoacyl-ACP synthase III [Bacteroidota bacterium]HMT76550.1 beta-ketoacyl-ACP synthase III [Saprospiraceae bacterium]HQW97288.1 beta-ketoacyl-ACP synthase III [Saprospiraceae bacterium]HRG43848.1 beta-ketoacyl-ACP synthase III [Saprospiraceae bacterium]
MIKAGITGVEGYVPETILSNADLEKMVDTNDEWIRTRTGIKERRIFNSPGKGVSDLALPAVLRLLESTNTKPEEVELVIFATVTADFIFPDTANILCDKAGLKNAFGFDVNAACSGFLFALTTGAQFIMAGSYKKVIVVGADLMSSITDYTDRATCIIFGDGAGAVMLEPTEDGTGLMDSLLKGDGAGRHVLHMKAGGSVKPPSHETVDAREHYVYQEGKHVFKHAVQGMASTVAEVMRRNNLSKDDIAWVVPHQANMRIINSVAEQLDFPLDKVMINIEKYGNTTSGTIPLCLWEWKDKLHKGDNIILTAFGGGFTWGSTLIKWSI